MNRVDQYGAPIVYYYKISTLNSLLSTLNTSPFVSPNYFPNGGFYETRPNNRFPLL